MYMRHCALNGRIAMVLLIVAVIGWSGTKRRVVEGTLIDGSGHAIATAATIVVASIQPKDHGRVFAKTESDSEGRFKIEFEVSGPAELRIQACGLESKAMPIKDSAEKTDIGPIKLDNTYLCSCPGVICDEVTEPPTRPDK